MTNAIITNHNLGINGSGMLYIQLAFIIKGEGEEPTITCATSPIFLLNEGESFGSSAAASVIGAILEIASVNLWEDLTGRAVQLEIEDGNITKIANILDEDKYIILKVNEPVAEDVEVTEE